MTDSQQQAVVDSPTGWVREHIEQYVATGGAEGHLWQGVPTLLLTTTGRRSGTRRRTALIYGRTGDGPGAAHVVVASKGGAPEHPAWFLNLQASPEAEIQVGPDVLTVRARVAEGDERESLWRRMAAIWPDYDQYQTRTDRQIPVVVLDPVA
ncbi:MAG: nitroreductase family deazaflavin-dependent oxidoreductase [Actinomycetales bacterium]